VQSGKSGQVLVITALLVTLLMLSAALYISDIEKNAPSNSAKANDIVQFCNLGLRHAVVSALANISKGGDAQVLVNDVQFYVGMLANHSYDGFVKLDFEGLGVLPYQEGILLSWGQDGEGVSSVFVDFALNYSGLSSTVFSEFSVNVTSAIHVDGHYANVNGSLKQANVTCNVSNEGEAALAQNFTVYYEHDGSLVTEEWLPASNINVISYGNGTYLLSFNAETLNADDSLLVSVYCWDSRSIFVRANVTCVQG
jgi:hypothetical protein